jgi:two-component system LytT family response regulator
VSLRVLVVDDEPAARATLRLLLEKADGCELVAECGDGSEALAAIRRTRPDLVLLDVQMPEQDGFAVLAALTPEETPAIVFVTAHDVHALRAFEANAVDYLLKPFSDGRFHAALERARERLETEGLATIARRLRALVDDVSAAAPPPARTIAREPAEGSAEPAAGRLLVHESGRTRVVRIADIEWIEAADYYSRLHTAEGGVLLRRSLADLETELDPRRFARVHRSAIVDLHRVSEIRPLFKGDAQLVLASGRQLRLSRRYRAGFLAALERLR